MSADKVKFIENVSEELTKQGCTFIERVDDDNSFWKTKWGILITVPDFGKEDKCPVAWWFDIMADIERTKPR